MELNNLLNQFKKEFKDETHENSEVFYKTKMDCIFTNTITILKNSKNEDTNLWKFLLEANNDGNDLSNRSKFIKQLNLFIEKIKYFLDLINL